MHKAQRRAHSLLADFALWERGYLWRSRPSGWVFASSAVDGAMVSALAVSGVLIEPLPRGLVVSAFGAATALAFILDQVKLSIVSAFRIA